MILEEISKDGEVDLNAFCNLVDLYTYMPQKLSKISKGSLSPDMFRIMSSNAKDKATAIKDTSGPDESRLNRNLELIWMRIDERFSNFSAAFRFFDMNFNNRVSFNEFSQGIETLKVKITLKEQLECFNYLDTEQK